jgi:site-specific DNA recombinase
VPFDSLRAEAPAIYVRVSSEEQVSGTSLDDQVDKCLKQAAVYGWEIPPERIYLDDGYSGSTLDRPAMVRLRQAVAAGEVDCVMVYKLDRLSRNIKDTVNLVLEEWSREHKVIFRSVTEDFNTNSPLGTLIFSILASFAHFERDVIRDRTENGRRRRFSQGRRAVGEPPFGYTQGEVNGTMVVEPRQAEVVQRIFRLYLQGHGFMKIAGLLNAAGHRTTSGREWTDKTVRDVAINVVYTGKVKYGGEHAQGQHEPIIDEQTFEAVQEVRKSRERVGGRTIGSPFLLAGVVRCKQCGHLFYTQPATESKRQRKDGSVYMTRNQAYYQCGGRLKKGMGYCRCGHIQQELLEAHVVERLKARFGAQVAAEQSVRVLQAEVEAQIAEVEATLARLESNVREKEQAIARWESAFEKGELDAARFGDRLTRLENEVAAIREQQAKLAGAREQLRQKRANTAWFQRVTTQVDQWEVLPHEVRKQLVQYLIDQVLVWKTSLGKGRFKQEPEIEVDIVWNRSERALPEGEQEWAPPAPDLPAVGDQ